MDEGRSQATLIHPWKTVRRRRARVPPARGCLFAKTHVSSGSLNSHFPDLQRATTEKQRSDLDDGTFHRVQGDGMQPPWGPRRLIFESIESLQLLLNSPGGRSWTQS